MMVQRWGVGEKRIIRNRKKLNAQRLQKRQEVRMEMKAPKIFDELIGPRTGQNNSCFVMQSKQGLYLI